MARVYIRVKINKNNVDILKALNRSHRDDGAILIYQHRGFMSILTGKTTDIITLLTNQLIHYFKQ